MLVLDRRVGVLRVPGEVELADVLAAFVRQDQVEADASVAAAARFD